MPSIDVVRNVTIRGRADGVDDATAALNRLTDSIKAANENLARSSAAANDNAGGFRITGEGAATAANHLRQAAEAAYAFSPAFRGVVNEMAVPVLGAAGTAIAAVAAGIVTATNYAGTGVIALAGAAEKASPSLLAYTGAARAAGIAMEGFSPSVGAAAGSILSFLTPALRLLGWATLAVKVIGDVGEAWRLGGEKLAEYVKLSEKAVASGVSTDFFQRVTKSAEEARLPVDALTAAMKRLADATGPQLGGTSAQNRLNDLVTAGNFTGNSGVGQLAGANTTEEKFRAISSLIDQAMQKGERLAALDVAKTFLGDPVASNLAKDSDYLNKMLTSSAEIAAKDLVSQTSIDNAVGLQNRLDAAEKILSQRWHPIQDLLTNGGIEMRGIWVNIVENIASAADWAGKLVTKLENTPSWFQRQLDRGATAFMLATTTPESRKADEEYYGITRPDPAERGKLVALEKLRSSMQNPANTDAARDQTNAIENAVFQDQSKDPGKKTITDTTSAYDRAEEALRRYSETSDAAAKSIDMTVDEQERLKAIAQLTAAGMKDGLTREAAAAKAEMSGLAQQAGAAALALEKAKVSSEIKFGAKTALLSQDDVQIATRLKGLYPDVATALGSVEAQGMRANNAFKAISSSIESSLTSGLGDIVAGTKSVSQGFSDMASSVLKAIEQMIIKIAIVQPLMQALQSSVSSSGILGFLGIGGGGGGSASGAVFNGAVDASGVVGLHSGGIVGSEATFTRYVHPAHFNDAPRFHTGGIAGDEVPIIAKRGEGVFTPGQMAAMGGGSQSVVMNDNRTIHIGEGASKETVAQLQAALAQDRRDRYADTVQIVADAKSRGTLQ